MKYVTAIFGCLCVATFAVAQDKVQYRERGGTGGVQTAMGRIESESLAGIKLGARTISSGDIIDVNYDVPALIKLDYPKAVAAETKSPADAIREYDALLKSPSLLNTKFLRRHFEFKIAMLTAVRADEGAEPVAKAIDALTRFRKDHSDGWQVVPALRTLGRLLRLKEPPDLEGARRVYDDLAAMNGVPADVRADCQFTAVDLLLQAGKLAEARARLTNLPANDPRVRIYEIGCSATNDKIADSAQRLEALIDGTNDRAQKAAAYNMLGDVYRRDPKLKKEAMYAYLWVDVVYNDDAAEVSKAIGRLSEIFAELKDDDRARKYRERLKGK